MHSQTSWATSIVLPSIDTAHREGQLPWHLEGGPSSQEGGHVFPQRVEHPQCAQQWSVAAGHLSYILPRPAVPACDGMVSAVYGLRHRRYPDVLPAIGISACLRVGLSESPPAGRITKQGIVRPVLAKVMSPTSTCVARPPRPCLMWGPAARVA
ncbi:hypothetical protein BP5796_08331 [Coleophoma crateriformis]|uniref:Uncharacterized protein n=1 Tax=Coleophoma crateriformis TaxID=565419 RepID=A0A3D8R7Y0_9HELO|nr:hypothetical protein BP5796_08331 [Coleophoma crateriformis]